MSTIEQLAKKLQSARSAASTAKKEAMFLTIVGMSGIAVTGVAVVMASSSWLEFPNALYIVLELFKKLQARVKAKLTYADKQVETAEDAVNKLQFSELTPN